MVSTFRGREIFTEAVQRHGCKEAVSVINNLYMSKTYGLITKTTWISKNRRLRNVPWAAGLFTVFVNMSKTEPQLSRVMAEKVCWEYAFILETTTSVMRWAETEWSRRRKRYSFCEQPKQHSLRSFHTRNTSASEGPRLHKNDRTKKERQDCSLID